MYFQKKRNQCAKCHVKFVCMELLKYHKENNHSMSTKSQKNSSGIECKLRYIGFKSRRGLQNHEQKMHADDSEFLNKDITAEDLKFDCKECDKKFVSKPILKNQIERHRLENYEFLRDKTYHSESKMFVCTLCHTKLPSFRGIVTHALYIHGEDIKLFEQDISEEDLVFQCNSCELKFVNELSLYYHNSKCHDLDVEKKHYKLCVVNFKTDNGFLHHKYKIHKLELNALSKNYTSSDMVFKCTICPKKCATQLSLDYHITNTHSKSNGKPKIKVKVEHFEKYCQLCYILYKEPRYIT